MYDGTYETTIVELEFGASNFTWIESENGIILTGFTNHYLNSENFNSSLSIPNSYKGYDIIGIGENAFDVRELQGKKLTSVELGDKVIKISSYAFFDNQISVLDLGNSVEEIGDNAFEKNQIANLVIPESLVRINDRAFRSNLLDRLEFPDTLTFIGPRVFENNIGGKIYANLLDGDVPGVGPKLRGSQFEDKWVLDSHSNYSYSYELPDGPIFIDSEYDFTLATVTPIVGTISYDKVINEISVEGPGKLTFTGTDSLNNVITQVIDKDSVGYWGPSSGFELPLEIAEGSMTNTFQISFDTPGDYVIKISLAEIEGSKIVVEESIQIEVINNED